MLGQHKRVTVVIDNALVLALARWLSALTRPMWLRYVPVPGLTDVSDEMKMIAEFATSLGVVERAEIFPFHQMGRFESQKLGLDYMLTAVVPPSPDSVACSGSIFSNTGLSAHRTVAQQARHHIYTSAETATAGRAVAVPGYTEIRQDEFFPTRRIELSL